MNAKVVGTKYGKYNPMKNDELQTEYPDWYWSLMFVEVDYYFKKKTIRVWGFFGASLMEII